MANPKMESLTQIHREFEAAFNAGDLDRLAGLYEPDAVLMPGGDAEVRGRDGIREALSMFLQGNPTIRLETAWSAGTSDGIALLSARWTLTGSGADGQPVERRGVSAEVIRRQADGRWLYIVDNPFAY